MENIMKKALFFLIGAPFFVWLFIFAAKYAIFGSDPYPPRTWQEEVRLSDGTVILTERYANWERPGRLARQSIKVIDAKGLDTPPEWSDKWDLMVLDRNEQGVWYIIIIGTPCYDWNDSFPYRQYQAINGRWQQVEFDKTLHGRPANLEGNIYPLLKNMPRLITVNEKQYAPTEARPDVTKQMDGEYWRWINIHALSGCDLYCWLYGENKSGVECEKYGFCEQPGNANKPQCYRYRETPNDLTPPPFPASASSFQAASFPQ